MTAHYDIAVIGGGPAGAMAAIQAGRMGKHVILIERNDTIGRKILITGKGRCNVTNMAPLDEFIARFGDAGNFLRSAFGRFFNEELVAFFQAEGLGMKTERQNRVFPETDDAKSVIGALTASLEKAGVTVRLNTRIARIEKTGETFRLTADNEEVVESRKVILTTGGASYKATGSTGDGFRFAQDLGHTVTALMPGLVPLKTRDTWVKDVQGLALKNITLTFVAGKKKLVSSVGEMLFTHFGVSGPLILDLSSRLARLIKDHGEIALRIDLKPGLTDVQLERRIMADIKLHGAKGLSGFLRLFMPSSLCPVFTTLSGIAPEKKVSQLTVAERKNVHDLMKALPLTLTGTLVLEEAMVTDGGISRKEIDPRTMQSRLVPSLYFAGEIIDGAASSGGYNLQQAFSTGYLAAEEAARDS